MDLRGFTRGKNHGKPDLWIRVLVEVSQAQIRVWPWSMVSTCVGTHGSVLKYIYPHSGQAIPLYASWMYIVQG